MLCYISWHHIYMYTWRMTTFSSLWRTFAFEDISTVFILKKTWYWNSTCLKEYVLLELVETNWNTCWGRAKDGSGIFAKFREYRYFLKAFWRKQDLSQYLKRAGGVRRKSKATVYRRQSLKTMLGKCHSHNNNGQNVCEGVFSMPRSSDLLKKLWSRFNCRPVE